MGLRRTITMDQVKTVEDKARFLIETFGWFDYQLDEREKAVENLLNYEHDRISAAYDYFIHAEYDYMAYGEHLSWAVSYIKGRQNCL